MMVRVYVLFGNGGEAAPFGDCDFVAFQTLSAEPIDFYSKPYTKKALQRHIESCRCVLFFDISILYIYIF